MEINREFLSKLSEFYKIFGDTTRLRILYCLKDKERCVNEISELLDISQSAISHKLKILRLYNLVRYEKKGQVVVYSITDLHVIGILEYGINHIGELLIK